MALKHGFVYVMLCFMYGARVESQQPVNEYQRTCFIIAKLINFVWYPKTGVFLNILFSSFAKADNVTIVVLEFAIARKTRI